MEIDPRLRHVVAGQPYPLLFVTISGAHLYGFPSRDSDYDLRGVHVLPAAEAVGLLESRETIEHSGDNGGLQIDLVTHDALKFFQMLLSRNGYVLEQLYSPLIVHATPEHEDLKTIAQGCITRHHAHHYLGFARTQWEQFQKHDPRRVKPLLYVYRVLLTAIHLMQTGEVQANLSRLNERFRLPHVAELIARKTAEEEHAVLANAAFEFHEREYARLTAALEQAQQASPLPDAPTSRLELNDLLIGLRLGRPAN